MEKLASEFFPASILKPTVGGFLMHKHAFIWLKSAFCMIPESTETISFLFFMTELLFKSWLRDSWCVHLVFMFLQVSLGPIDICTLLTFINFPTLFDIMVIFLMHTYVCLDICNKITQVTFILFPMPFCNPYILISTGVDGGLSGGSSVCRPGSEDPHHHQQKLVNVNTSMTLIRVILWEK